MIVRNFWVKGWVDGRDREVVFGGPRSKDGGFSLDVYVRDEGSSSKKVSIEGFVAAKDGKLNLFVCCEGHEPIRIVTER